MTNQWNDQGGDRDNEESAHQGGSAAEVCVAVDMTVLEQYRALQDEGDPDIVSELIDAFFGDVPTRLSGILEAVSSNNPTQLEREAHNLKGSSANLGAKQLSAISHELETRGRKSELEGAEAVVDRLESEFERVHAFLEKERKAP